MANIKEIARRAGVSTATVSRVLNGHPYVSGSIRARILEIISEVDYVPNANARSLKNGSTRLIGIIAISLSPLLLNFIRAFTEFAQQYGFNITLFMTNGDMDKELVALEMLRSKQLDALVCVLRANDWEVIEAYTKYGPIVTWQRLQSEKIPSVFMDQYQAYMMGIEHLYTKGYRRILSIYAMSKGLNTKERIRAHADFVAKYDIPDHGFPQFQDKASAEDGEELARWWAAQTNRPDAIFCSTDEVAAGAVTELRRRGFAVPGDVGVMGFDNTGVAHLLDLTTIHYPVDLQAENAFLLIQNKLTQSDLELHSLEYRLIERSST